MNIQATPAYGYVIGKWSDGNTSAIRTVTMNTNTTLVASFKEQGDSTDTGSTGGESAGYLYSIRQGSEPIRTYSWAID